MQVLKVVGEGLITSFRYHHFMQGIQPTFEIPPPATIYGHICSVLGEWFDPGGVEFAIHFSFQSRFQDIEHTHILTPATGKLPGTQIAKVLEGSTNPFIRELLFKPRMILYINRPEWVEAFRSPRYPVVLGRSQDLFTYTQVEVIELRKDKHVYLEHTLVPYNFVRYTGKGIVALLPRFLDYHKKRYPEFSRYVVLHRRVHSRDLLSFQDEDLNFWTDPTSPEIDGDKLGLIFHNWVDKDDALKQMA
ncbi:MAG: hypothetical protein JG781_1226 [Peptococcaceae bacterium]|jgi:CRISPR-associated protein Cas5t|nr:hypothetical protein [Peptococcaceae bacterium]